MLQQLETERLLIRPLSIHDKNFILELLNAPGWIQFIGDRNINNERDAENYIQTILVKDECFYKVFELKSNLKPIGIITFLYREEYDYPDLGFAMLPDYEKQGYAFEACQQYLIQVKKEFNGDKIIAITLPHNHNSIALLKKLGFIYEKNVIDRDETLSLFSLTLK